MTNKLETLATIGRFLEALEEGTDHASLGAQQIQLLIALYTYGEMSQQALMKHTGAQKTTHSRHIAKLSVGENPLTRNGPGWIESYEDVMDRRTKLVRLTPRGRAMLDRVTEATFRQ